MGIPKEVASRAATVATPAPMHCAHESDRRAACGTFPTLRASQVGSCSAAVASSLKAAGGNFRLWVSRADATSYGPSQAIDRRTPGARLESRAFRVSTRVLHLAALRPADHPKPPLSLPRFGRGGASCGRTGFLSGRAQASLSCPTPQPGVRQAPPRNPGPPQEPEPSPIDLALPTWAAGADQWHPPAPGS